MERGLPNYVIEEPGGSHPPPNPERYGGAGGADGRAAVWQQMKGALRAWWVMEGGCGVKVGGAVALEPMERECGDSGCEKETSACALIQAKGGVVELAYGEVLVRLSMRMWWDSASVSPANRSSEGGVCQLVRGGEGKDGGVGVK
jgi:hypothetical protein